MNNNKGNLLTRTDRDNDMSLEISNISSISSAKEDNNKA